MRDVAVIGVGETEFGELWDRSFRDLGIEAGLKAIQDAKLRSEDIDAVYIGNMSAGKFIDQEHVSALVADYAGLADMHLPTVRVEGGGACGAIALFQARLAIASGMYDIVVVGGAEKMTDVGEVQAAEILSSTADQEWETVFGATFAGLYAMMARRHMYEYGTTREQMAAVAVKNHKNGALNPEAQFQKEITLETVLQAPWVAEPLGLFDCAPLSDGAAADGLTALNGKISVNTSGGLKARGQPVGATGVAQAVEIVRQLRGQGGKRQVVGARRGLTHTLGGTGATAVVHIFERGD